MIPVLDDPYLRIMLGCAHEQRAHGLQVGRVGRRGQYKRSVYDAPGPCMPRDSKHNVANFLTSSTDLLYLQVPQMSRCPNLAIFVLTADRQTNRLLYPLRMRAG
jgi:hypothetical protein